MKKIRYLITWKNGTNRPVPEYHFYPKGVAEPEGFMLEQALRRYPENRYQWEMIR